MNKLKRSHDRKVTNLVNAKGNGSLIQSINVQLNKCNKLKEH